MEFEEIEWHDAVINNIVIDRKFPGKYDAIKFDISLPIDDENIQLLFEELYKVEMSLNFGIIAEETISQIEVYPEDTEEIMSLKKNWKGQLDDIKLIHYNIKLNSTGGCVNIICKDLKIIRN